MSTNKFTVPFLCLFKLWENGSRSPKNLHEYERPSEEKACWNITWRKSVHLHFKARAKWACLSAWKHHFTKIALISPGQRATLREKRWIGGLEGVAAVCVFAFGVCREGLSLFFLFFVLFCFFFFFYDAICAAARKARIVRPCEPPREWSPRRGVNDNTIWTSHTASLSWLQVAVRAPRKTRL